MKNTGKIGSFLKNKNTVTAISAILIVVILIVGYQIRVNNATKPIRVPFAKVTIQPRTLITADMIDYKNVPGEALGGDYFSENEMAAYAANGRTYTKVNTIIPAGSLFYKAALTDRDDLPDTALYNVPEGETLYYLTVNMLSTYTNSVLPGNYIDVYVSYRDNSQAVVGKILSNVKVLAVKTNDGKNVFENSNEQRIPYVIFFSLGKEEYSLMRQISAINQFGLSTINISIVPTNVGYSNDDKHIDTYVSSTTMKEYINNLAHFIDEDVIQNTNGGGSAIEENPEGKEDK